MAAAKSQSAFLLKLLKRGLRRGKVPQSVSEEAAGRGNNVYVLDFKHFLPVRKSRCKGMFVCLKDLKDFYFCLCFFLLFLVSRWSDRVGLSVIATLRGFCAKYAHRLNMLPLKKKKNLHVGKMCFLNTSDTFKFVRGILKVTFL